MIVFLICFKIVVASNLRAYGSKVFMIWVVQTLTQLLRRINHIEHQLENLGATVPSPPDPPPPPGELFPADVATRSDVPAPTSEPGASSIENSDTDGCCPSARRERSRSRSRNQPQ